MTDDGTTDDENGQAQEAYLNEHFGGGLLGVSPEQVHDFVESAATQGGGEPEGSHTIREHDVLQELKEDGDEATKELVSHGVVEGVEHAAHLALGPVGVIVSTVAGMSSDQPEVTPERQAAYEERQAREAAEARAQAEREQFARDHPGMDDEPDAGVRDASTQ